VNDSPPVATALRGHEQAGRESAPLRQKRTRRFGGPRSPVHRLIVIGGQPLLVFCKGGEASLQVLELSLFRESDRPVGTFFVLCRLGSIVFGIVFGREH
jgi:hypothetical protein